MGGKSFLDSSPFFSRHLVPQNVGNIIFVCYFLNIGSEPKKVNVLGTSPNNQFRDYFIWNRIKKLMPQLWNCPPQTLKTLKQTDQPGFKPWLFWTPVQYWEINKQQNNVSDVLWDQMSRKKGEWVQELFPTHPTYHNPMFMNPKQLLWRFLDFSVFHFLPSFFSFVAL